MFFSATVFLLGLINRFPTRQCQHRKYNCEYSYIISVLLNPPTSDQSTTDHLPTDQRTHQLPTHRPTDLKFTDPLARFYFKYLIIKKNLFCRMQRRLEKCKTIIRSVWTFVFITNMKDIRKNQVTFIIMFTELGFKL